jgi:hypothetical protein
MENIKTLSQTEIIEKLKSMEVGEGKELPHKLLNIITVNKDYDMENFSQEIEDSEEEVDILKEVIKEIQKPDFNWIWHNTIGNKKNSDKWYANHTKKCKTKFHPMAITLLSNSTDSQTGRNYYTKENVEKILEFAKQNGEIVDFN